MGHIWVSFDGRRRQDELEHKAGMMGSPLRALGGKQGEEVVCGQQGKRVLEAISPTTQF